MLRKPAIEGSNTVTEKLVAEVQPTEHPAFNEFVATIEALRSPDGCPWDKEQTHKSISGNMVEEAYEAVDAIEADDVPHMREELGDVLLQVVLQSQIAADAGEFTIDDVCRDVNAKIVRRHPHVFGDVVAGDANEVLDVWDQIKMAEKESADAAADAPQGLLDGVPKSFPALKQAQSEGRLVELPCKAGDTIYQLRNKKHAKGKGISPRIATCVTVFGSKMYRVEHQGATPCEVYDLGKTWFLTREAAEAALAEKEEE